MMHPVDAAARGLTGGEVKIWNERGELILPLHVTEKVPPGVVASEKGDGCRRAGPGRQFQRWFRPTPVQISLLAPASTIRASKSPLRDWSEDRLVDLVAGAVAGLPI